MVLEALAAFSLACNIIQTIDYGTKVFQKAKEYGCSKNDRLPEHQALAVLAEDLSRMSSELSSKIGQGVSCRTAVEARLFRVNENCIAIAKMFLGKVNALQLPSDASRFSRLRMAFKASWQASELDAFRVALSEARNSLHLSFTFYMHNDLQRSISQITDNRDQRILTAIDRYSNSSPDSSSSTDTLSEAIHRLNLNASAYDLDDDYVNDKKIRHPALPSRLDRLADRCERAEKELRSVHARSLKDISEALNESTMIPLARRQLAKGYEPRAIDVQRTVLRALETEVAGCNDRYAQIKSAHEDTFIWALQRDTEAEAPCLRKWFYSKLRTDHTFWISGKPGSGKSTLMRFLKENLFDVQARMSESECFILEHYFWSSGSTSQRSVVECLRALLSQILERCPWLINEIPDLGRPLNMRYIDSRRFMRQSKLEADILRALKQLDGSVQVVLILNGLDEIAGKTEDNICNMLDFLAKLQKLDNIKMCLSSRSWLVFEDWFKNQPQIRMEDLTHSDIRHYAEAKLCNDQNFARSCLHKPAAVRELISDLVDRAHGVFLWVYLVVRELIVGARDGETLRTLQLRFNAIPEDLNKYFERIMRSIKQNYAWEASAMFQLQLAFVSSDPYDETLSLYPLRIMDVVYLDHKDPSFAFSPRYTPDFDYDNDVEKQAIQDLTERRVVSRCMGLLEVNDAGNFGQHSEQRHFGKRLDFFHRTFADYLRLPDIQRILCGYTCNTFDVRMYRVNVHAVLLPHMLGKNVPIMGDRTSRYCRDVGRIMRCHPDLSARLTEPIERQIRHHSQLFTYDNASVVDVSFNDIAVMFCWLPWIEEHLDDEFVVSSRDRLLQHALYPRYRIVSASVWRERCWSTLKILEKVASLPDTPSEAALKTMMDMLRGISPSAVDGMTDLISILLQHVDEGALVHFLEDDGPVMMDLIRSHTNDSSKIDTIEGIIRARSTEKKRRRSGASESCVDSTDEQSDFRREQHTQDEWVKRRRRGVCSMESVPRMDNLCDSPSDHQRA